MARDFDIRPEEAVGKSDHDFFPKADVDKYRADDWPAPGSVDSILS
jgi:hypothetical protein